MLITILPLELEKKHTANEKEPYEQVKTDNEIIESNEEKKCIYYI